MPRAIATPSKFETEFHRLPSIGTGTVTLSPSDRINAQLSGSRAALNCDLRRYMDACGNRKFRPTEHGIVIPVSALPEVIELLQNTLFQAQSRGLLPTQGD